MNSFTCGTHIHLVRFCKKSSYYKKIISLWVKIMPAKFEMYADAAGKCRWRLKAPNGEIIATSEAYESEASCKNGIASVKKNAPIAEIVKV